MNNRLCLLLFLVLLLAGCGDRREYRATLERAKAVMNDAPDSALVLIDSVLKYENQLPVKLRMQCRLHRLNAENKLDSVFHSADRARELVDYFSRHGKANEQVLAYYLLGRAYSDMGEAPMAMESYSKAIGCADTTHVDCDYRLLCRVYYQKATLLHYQYLFQEELEDYDRGIEYAWRGNDTLAVLSGLSHKSDAYDRLGVEDSVLYINELSHTLYNRHGYPKEGARCLASSIDILSKRGEIEKARKFMHIYEAKSGYFDANGNIEKGREIYYYLKGVFYLSTHRLDSAEYYFRKELQGGDLNNYEGSARGLSLVYKTTHQLDSALKYALLSYELNDSATNQTVSGKVTQIQAMYDYSRNMQKAQMEEQRAKQALLSFGVVVAILFVVIATTAFYYRRVQKEKAITRLKQRNNYVLLEKTQSELTLLKQSGADLQDLIREKEETINRLKAAFATTTNIESLADAERLLRKDSRYQHLQKLALRGAVLTEADWQDLEVMIMERLPGFQDFLSAYRHLINETEYRVCILIRLHLKPNAASYALELSAAAVSKARRNMLRSIFGVVGGPAEFDKRILAIC